MRLVEDCSRFLPDMSCNAWQTNMRSNQETWLYRLPLNLECACESNLSGVSKSPGQDIGKNISFDVEITKTRRKTHSSNDGEQHKRGVKAI